jgi:UDP:flavonoid glycosyltransferase YjiC (YdhE family)
MDEKRGPEMVFKFMVADLPRTYDDIRRAIDAYAPDVLVTSELAYAGPIAADKVGLRWASVTLSPIAFLSPYDETILPPVPWLSRLHALGPRVYGLVLGLARRGASRFAAPIEEFRRAQGLPPVAAAALRGQAFARAGAGDVLADHRSAATRLAQADRRHRLRVLRRRRSGDESEARSVSEAGEAPIVFTLGSAAVFDPGAFFDEASRRRCLQRRRLPRRSAADRVPTAPLIDGAIGVFDYAPFSKLFPRAAAVVHQGGSGTTGQALRAGRPMLIVPFAHDQPDNALRAKKLGVSATIRRSQYDAATAAGALRDLLGNPAAAARAGDIARIVAAENGSAVAGRRSREDVCGNLNGGPFVKGRGRLNAPSVIRHSARHLRRRRHAAAPGRVLRSRRQMDVLDA